MPPRRIFIIAAVTALAGAAPAQARIVPNRGMAGVRLGMSQQRVLDILGDPSTDFTYRSGITTYAYEKLRLRVSFLPGGGDTNDVFMLFTNGRRERTKEGVGVGTGESTLRRRLHGEHCFSNSVGRFCTLGGGDEGAGPETSFAIGRRHRVKSVRIIASDY